MPAPATIEELLELVIKSGVTDESRLRSHIQQLRIDGTLPSEPSKLAGQLVRDGFLTYFQAEQLLQGKWKRFTIGKYKVLERLGSGGMGQVFLCEHKVMRRRVAVKVLPTAKAEDPASLDRFYREARAVAAVDHPNLVRAYDIDQDNNLHFLVMEYVDGTNLQDLVKKFGPLEVTRACHYIYGAAVGLQHAHEVGLVHRDIKPGNILIDRNGVVKILDLGLARFFHDEVDDLTKKYDENVLGTADYLAPEQALESHTVDIRADIYSLGATFYFLLTGSPPFPEGSVAQKLIWHQTRAPKPIQEIRPEVSSEVVAIIEKMMAKDASQRYQTPAEVMAALAAWVAIPIPPPSDQELPQLSPAASYSLGITRPSSSAPTMVSPIISPAERTAATASVVGSASTATWPVRTGAATLPQASTEPPQAVPSNGASWAALSDTQTLEGAETDGSAVITPSSLSSQILSSAGTRTYRRKIPLWIYAAGAVVFAVASVVATFLFLNRSSNSSSQQQVHTQPPTQVHKPRTIYVSKEGGEDTYTTLQRALVQSSPGDRIEIKDEVINEHPTTLPLRIGGAKLKGITITSNRPGNTPAVIELSGGNPDNPAPAMMELINAEGVTLNNLIIDCKWRFETALSITGKCPGLTIDGVTIRNSATGIRIENATGTPDQPIKFDGLYMQLPSRVKQAVAIVANPDKANGHITIGYSRFEGIATKSKDKDGKEVSYPSNSHGIMINGSCDNLFMYQNRFYNINRAVSVAEAPPGGSVNFRFENNTLHTLRGGIFFEANSDTKASYKAKVSRNIFLKVDLIARSNLASGRLFGFEAETNVRDSSSRENNLPSNSVVSDDSGINKPGTVGMHDRDFLRIPRHSKLYKGLIVQGHNVPVGFTGRRGTDESEGHE